MRMASLAYTTCRHRKKHPSTLTCSRECKKCEGMNLHTPKWTPIVGVGVPNGLLNLQSEIAGVKTHRLEKFFILLESYWNIDVYNGSHCPFGYLKQKLWSKERPRVKLTIWLMTTKSQESTRFPHMQETCDIPLESSWQGLQLYFRPHYNRMSPCKVMGPQSCKSLSCGNFEPPAWESQDKKSFGCGTLGEVQSIL